MDIENHLPWSGLECGDLIEGEFVDTECGDAPSLHGLIRTGIAERVACSRHVRF
jgi:hypothetical protein